MLWANNNLEAQIDFGYRATHVAAPSGKAISERDYSKAPVRSYFVGCSTGGYQGMTEAQRFPWRAVSRKRSPIRQYSFERQGKI